MFKFSFNKNKAKIIETKTFSEISGFSFDYPVFKNWGIKAVEKKSDNEYIIWVDWPQDINFDNPPQINIKKIQEQKIPVFEKISDVNENKNSTSYEFIYFPDNYIERYDPKEHWDAIHFYKNDFLDGVLIDMPIDEPDYGFSREIFVKKIIETFKFD